MGFGFQKSSESENPLGKENYTWYFKVLKSRNIEQAAKWK